MKSSGKTGIGVKADAVRAALATSDLPPDPVVHVTEAYLGWDQTRADFMQILYDDAMARSEEVYILRNTSAWALQLVTLPPREAKLQLNFKAVSSTGENLILLSQRQIRELTGPVYDMARSRLRTFPGIPRSLHTFLGRDDWNDPEAEKRWRDSIAIVTRAEINLFFWEDIASALDELDHPPTPEDVALVMLVEHLSNVMNGIYRPWVYLPSPSPGRREDGALEGHVFIKYVTDEPKPYPTDTWRARCLRLWDRFRGPMLGYNEVAVDVASDYNSSSHTRFRPPEGAIIDRPLELPVGVERVLMRKQAQFYIPPQMGRSAPASDLEFSAHIAQAPSIRFIAAVLFAVVTFFPLLLIEVELHNPVDPEKPLGVLSKTWDLELWRPTLQMVQLTYVEKAFGLSFPLAAGMFAASWDRPYVRAFVVTQLVLAVLVTALWVAAPWIPAMGGIALVIGGFFTLLHAWRGAKGLWPLP